MQNTLQHETHATDTHHQEGWQGYIICLAGSDCLNCLGQIAQNHRYAGEPTAYLASGNARWAADARDWVAHVDAVMAYAHTLINGVQAGTIAQPTLAEFRAGLPCIVWSYQDNT